MMKSLRYSTRAKKDLKKYRNQPQKMRRLFAVIEMLLKGEKLPPSLRKHELSGRYAGALECHIENDFLLIWEDKDNNCIYILRLGSHSELFNS